MSDMKMVGGFVAIVVLPTFLALILIGGAAWITEALDKENYYRCVKEQGATARSAEEIKVLCTTPTGAPPVAKKVEKLT